MPAGRPAIVSGRRAGRKPAATSRFGLFHLISNFPSFPPGTRYNHPGISKSAPHFERESERT
jgi:hypothetical protein